MAVVVATNLARRADAITVTTTADSGAGSLRQAISDAASGGSIDFDPSLYIDGRTITLTSAELAIAKNLTISGTGRITISGSNTHRVFNVTSGTVTLQGLTIRDGNSGNNAGGGIANSGTLTLSEVMVTENTAGGGGGGVVNYGTLIVQRSTIARNVSTSAYGGGIDNVFGGSLQMTNSTVSENVSLSNGGGIDNYANGSTATILFSTIVGNRAAGTGGGIHGGEGPSGAVTLTGSIVARNGAPTSPDCSGTLTSGNYDLVGSTAGCTLSGTTTNNQTGVDPLLGSLQTNGAGTPTHALQPGSPAMDKIPSATCTALSGVDQRAYTRPQDGGHTGSTSCDIGAYEARTPIVVDTLVETGDPTKCSLGAAISAANNPGLTVDGCAAATSAMQTRIVFAVNGTIPVTGGGFQVTRSVMFDGPGATRLTLSGERVGRIFTMQGGFPSVFGISGLTLANGNANQGGAIWALSGYIDALSIDRVAFEDDVATSNGGALFTDAERSVEIDASSFSNTRPTSGAYVVDYAGLMTIRNTTFGETRSTAAVLSISDQAGLKSLVRLIGTTVKGTGPIGAWSVVQGTGDAGSAVLEYRNSVFAGHGVEVQADAGGVVVSGGYNVLDDASGAPAVTGDLKSTNPLLGLHLFGGGPTKTMAPLVGSPAMERIPLERCFTTSDQRGVPRPLDGDHAGASGCDAGAFESPYPIVVNSLLDTADPGKCRLRDAIAAVNTSAAVNGCLAGMAEAPGLITFGVNGTINLASELVPTRSVAVRGPGATKLTLSGQGASRVFDIGFVTADLTLTGLTIANGSGAGFGGGVLAGVLNGTVAIAESTFRNNVAQSSGGALYAGSVKAVQLVRSTFTNPGGSSALALVSITNSNGVAESSTFNDASGAQAIEVVASGASAASRLVLKGVTVSGSDPVGLKTYGTSGAASTQATVEYTGSIFAGHATCISLGAPTGTSLGYNVASDGTGGLTATGDKPSTNAMLGPLSYHGGETPVFDLLPASPAKDAIPSAECDQAFDQRGFARPFGSGCDSGAVERIVGGDVNGDGVTNVADVFYMINFLFAGGPVPIGEADVNGDGNVNVADVFYLINRLFAGGTAPL